MIIGAHPSVVQEMEVKQNKDGDNVFIAYSIGTYISTLSQEQTRTELVLNIDLRKSGKDGKVYLNKVDYTQLKMIDNGVNAEDRFVLKWEIGDRPKFLRKEEIYESRICIIRL